jgi:predicted alpha-1,2-mannosidase
MRAGSLLGVAAFVLAAACSEDTAPPDAMLGPVDTPTDVVDPLIATGGFGYAAGSGVPGAAVPGGFVKIGPDTEGAFGTVNFLHYAGYWAGDDTVLAFSHLHLEGTGATDYGVLGVMPVAQFDGTRTTDDGHASKMDKASEHAEAGYYAVHLTREDIQAEFTASAHTAVHRYRFPQASAQGTVVFDLDHHLQSGSVSGADVTLDPAAGTIRGRLHSIGGMSAGFGGYDVFFAARASKPWTAQVWTQASPMPAPGAEAHGVGVGFALTFDVSDHAPVELQVAVSLVDAQGADAILAAEPALPAFDQVRGAARDAWNGRLRAVRVVAGGSDDDRRAFYSALYRTLLMPSVTSDPDGRFRYGAQVGTAAGYAFVNDLSLWDTYRTTNPLYALLWPDRARDVVRSLDQMAQIGGFFPKWPLATGESGVMLGSSAEIVVADAYLRGVRDFDAESVFQRLRPAAMDAAVPPGGRGGRADVVEYMQLGYVPQATNRSVSLTTEYARDDFALGNLAGALGHADDAATLAARAQGWRLLYDPAKGFLRGKDAAGAFVGDGSGTFDPTLFTSEFAEADAWQSLWMCDHDLDGLIQLHGGQDAFVQRLESFFEQSKAEQDAIDPKNMLAYTSPRSYYWAGNEPDIQAAYLFARAGRLDLTARWVRWIEDTFYAASPAGVPGNDDGGTMSAWLVFSSLGFYPIVGSDRYVLGVPRFGKVEIAVPAGVFTIQLDGPPGGVLAGVTLDGAPAGPEITQAQIKAGSVLQFHLR